MEWSQTRPESDDKERSFYNDSGHSLKLELAPRVREPINYKEAP